MGVPKDDHEEEVLMLQTAPKRWLALTGAAMLVVAACTSGASPSPSPAPTTAASTAPSGSASAAPADPAATRAAICDAAKAEGKLVYWSNFANPDPIMAAFSAVYPGITIEPLSNHPDDFAQALLTELAAGRKPSADIMYGELNVLAPIFDVKGSDESIDWQALGVADDIISKSGNVVRLYRVAGGIVYNTNKHKPEDLPATWAGLLDQKYDSQIVVDPRGRPFDQLALIWGHDQAVEYAKQLQALKPIVIKGGTAGMLAVASEQAAVTTGGRSAETLEQQSKGAPLAIKYLDVITTLDTYNMVPKDAPHPNAAKCMVAWLATDGQKIHDESEFKSNSTIPTGAPADAQYAEVKDSADADKVKAVGEEIGVIFSGTGG